VAQSVWDRRYANYTKRDILEKPSIFARFVSGYLPDRGNIIELGAGNGRDSRFFARNGFEIISTDFSEAACNLNNSLMPDDLKSRITIRQLDMTNDFPFPDVYFDIVYAHLSLHYFSMPVTRHIISEIGRILRAGGIFAYLVNSTSDPEYGQGPRLEEDYYQIGEDTKRYFSIESAEKLASGFEIMVLDDLGEAYWQSERGAHNLIRFIGKKAEKKE
jgi:SAM-dependent methyltransferase